MESALGWQSAQGLDPVAEVTPLLMVDLELNGLEVHDAFLSYPGTSTIFPST